MKMFGFAFDAWIPLKINYLRNKFRSKMCVIHISTIEKKKWWNLLIQVLYFILWKTQQQLNAFQKSFCVCNHCEFFFYNSIRVDLPICQNQRWRFFSESLSINHALSQSVCNSRLSTFFTFASGQIQNYSIYSELNNHNNPSNGSLWLFILKYSKNLIIFSFE